MMDTQNSPSARPDDSVKHLLDKALAARSQFELIQELGTSATSIVYLVHDRRLNRRIAIKAQVGKEQRLAASSLDHENLVRVYSEERDPSGVSLILRQFVDGGPLSRWKNESPEEWIGIAVEAFAALEYVHSEQAVHGRLSPQNVLVDRNRRVYLSDLCPQTLANDDTRTADVQCLAHLFLATAPEADAPLRAILQQGMELPTTAGEMKKRLQGWLEQQEYDEVLPSEGLLVRLTRRFPLVSSVILRELPHVLGTIFVATYSFYRRGSYLTPEQRARLAGLVRTYTSLSYPISIGLLLVASWGLVQVYKKRRENPVDVVWNAPHLLGALRRNALRLPVILAGINSLTWLTAILFFSIATYLVSGRLRLEGFAHFSSAIIVGWLISTSYATYHTLFLSIQILYPTFLAYEAGRSGIAQRELARWKWALSWLPYCLALVPAAVGLLLVLIGPHDASEATFRAYKLLLIELTAFSAIGFTLALSGTRRLQQLINALSA